MRTSNHDNLYLALECAAILFAVSASMGSFYVWSQGLSSALTYAVIIGLPAFAGLIMVLIGQMLPGLLAVGQVRFPLNLTLPLVYTSLLLLSVVLWTNPGSSLIRISPQLAIAHYWTEPKALLIGLVCQIFVMSGIVAARKGRR